LGLTLFQCPRLIIAIKAYNDKYHPEPSYPAGYKPKSYPREAEADYAPKPYSGGKDDVNPFEIISDAALALLKWKLALIKEGAKIILSPFEQVRKKFEA
jgi:hypothetical protein